MTFFRSLESELLETSLLSGGQLLLEDDDIFIPSVIRTSMDTNPKTRLVSHYDELRECRKDFTHWVVCFST